MNTIVDGSQPKTSPLNLQIYYPVPVLQGKLFIVSDVDDSPELEEANHVQFSLEHFSSKPHARLCPLAQSIPFRSGAGGMQRACRSERCRRQDMLCTGRLVRATPRVCPSCARLGGEPMTGASSGSDRCLGR